MHQRVLEANLPEYSISNSTSGALFCRVKICIWGLIDVQFYTDTYLSNLSPCKYGEREITFVQMIAYGRKVTW
jgi:hypothetical protein